MIEMLRVSYMLLPLLGGLAFHGFCMKFKWLSFLGRPIDGGRTFRGRQLFGPNKTYRGIIAVGFGTAVGCGIQAMVGGLSVFQPSTHHNCRLLSGNASDRTIASFESWIGIK